jgi:serine/threonine protein kinase
MENEIHGSGRSDTDSLVDALNSPLFSPTTTTTSATSNRNGTNVKDSNHSHDNHSIPSIHLNRANIKDQNKSSKDAQFKETSSNPADGTVVSPNQEIQTLLLILLAQVCALHDSTPKTFVVHVLSLYERGILEYDSIAFIFDLGLVPAMPASSSLSPTARLANFAFDGYPDKKQTEEQPSSNDEVYINETGLVKEEEEEMEEEDDTKMAAIIPYQPSYPYSNHGSEVTHTIFDSTQIIHQIAQIPKSNSIDSNAELRSQHVYAIRRHLESYHNKSNSKSSQTTTHNLPVTSTSSSSQSSWSVEHHPLSLSRYNREFIQKRLLAAGSFGEVFHSMNKLDNVDYAIKRVAFSAKGYDYSQVEMVIREVQCLAKLGHENVVRYYTSWLEPSWMTGSSSEHDHNDHDGEGEDYYNGSEYTHDCTNRNEIVSHDVQKRLLNNFQRLVIGGPNDPSLNGDDDDVLSKIEHELRHVKSSWSLEDGNDQSRYSDDYNSISEGGYGGSECSEWTQDMSSCGRNPMQRKRISTRQGTIPTKEDSAPISDDRKPSKSYRYQICLFIQMQLCQPSTLADWIRERNSNDVLSTTREQGYLKAWDIFQQIANGLSHVHSKNVVHRDLKPANIFHTVDQSLDSFKIGDFGLSKLLRKANNNEDFTEDSFSHDALIPLNITKGSDRRFTQEPLTQGVGTSSYAAPEQLKSQIYGSEADIFSLGLILLELFSSFDSEHERAKIFHDCRRGILPNRFIRGDTYLKNVGELILACTSMDPKVS